MGIRPVLSIESPMKIGSSIFTLRNASVIARDMLFAVLSFSSAVSMHAVRYPYRASEQSANLNQPFLFYAAVSSALLDNTDTVPKGAPQKVLLHVVF